MKIDSNFDEKQLLDRGKAFQIGFITAIIMSVLFYFLQDGIGIEIAAFTSFAFSLWIPVTVCSIALIIKDAYDGVNSTTGRFGITVFGAGGSYILISSIIFLATGRETLLDGGVVTESIGHIINGICMITICAVYWVKQHLNKRKFIDESSL